MSPERKAERETHDALRVAIRAASIAWANRIAAEDDDRDNEDDAREHNDAMRTAILVDYVVIAAYDDGNDDRDYMAILRTDGKASHYRTLGLLTTAAESL